MDSLSIKINANPVRGRAYNRTKNGYCFIRLELTSVAAPIAGFRATHQSGVIRSRVQNHWPLAGKEASPPPLRLDAGIDL
jgi:hypothetical protein